MKIINLNFPAIKLNRKKRFPINNYAILKKSIVALQLFFPILLFGQNEYSGFSINPKAGIYQQKGDDDGLSVGIEFNRINKQTVYSIDVYFFQEFTLMDPIPDNQFMQIGFMIGNYHDTKLIRIQYQGGIAPFSGSIYTKAISGEPGTPSYRYYQKESFFALGLAGKLGLKLVPSKFLALGIDLQANLNLKNPLFFPCLSLEIGKLRN